MPRQTPPHDRLEEEAFQELRALVLRHGGIDLSLYKDRYMRRRITVRQRACGAENLPAYLKALGRDPTELSRLVKALTINVSEFFRNPATFHAVAARVLPALLEEKGASGSRALRFWSAGCATGEEPYSLAIVLQEVAGDRLAEFSPAIYATDIDRQSLDRARLGVYGPRSLANLLPGIRQRYFVREGLRYRVREEVKRLVFFKRHNLLDPVPFGRIDLVVLRNVLIYMAEALQERVVVAVYGALNPGGYLVLGKVEGIPARARDLFEAVNVAERIYRKVARGAPASPSRPPAAWPPGRTP